MPEHPALNVIMFPGVILHELSHAAACVLTGTKITKTKLWGMREAYIQHEETSSLKNLLISMAPLIAGLAIATTLYLIGHATLEWRTRAALYWLGASAATQSFPSTQDAINAIETLTTSLKKSLFLKKGIIRFLFSWATLPVSLPLIVILYFVKHLAKQAHLGLASAIVLFLVTLWMVS